MNAQTHSYYDTYIKNITETDPVEALKNNLDAVVAFMKTVPAEKYDYRYAPGKWTIKQVIIHVIDSERIFAYRALCIARGEKQSLPGFDENLYAENSNPDSRDWNQLAEDFVAARKSNIELYKSFTNAALNQTGIANNFEVSPLFLAKVIAGHCQHHLNVMKERYL